MSKERLNHHEKSKTIEVNGSEHLERISIKHEKAAEKQPNKGEQLEQLSKKLESFTKDKEKSPIKSERKPQKQNLSRAHKSMTYKATMNRIESKLPPYQRAFSKFINNDKVDAVSNIASRTIARPSGILGGGIAALVALSYVTYFANKIGFSVSGSEFIVATIGGYILGLAAEFILKSLKKMFI